ncbi:hypothetical protein L1887_12085 [Cichorium endivia]|nr:hypothetical protein L1887_12085 [Cichorium endivia]
MALLRLRELLNNKPPDGLLDVFERVYVFDSCFRLEPWDQKAYKAYVRNVTNQFQETNPDSSIMILNFREVEAAKKIHHLLSRYYLTIMDYPKHYEGCPLLSMEAFHHFLRSSDSWLSLGQQNVLLIHCELGGWPVLAFMLAALLLYRKDFTSENRALELVHKLAPKSDILSMMSPLDPSGSQLRIFGRDPFLQFERTPQLLFPNPRSRQNFRSYDKAENELVKFDINCNIQGDIVLECINLDDMVKETIMYRVMFNTAFIKAQSLMLNRDEIDVNWDTKNQFHKDFTVELLFSGMDPTDSKVPVDLSDSLQTIPIKNQGKEGRSSLPPVPASDQPVSRPPAPPPPPPAPSKRDGGGGPFPPPLGGGQRSPPPATKAPIPRAPPPPKSKPAPPPPPPPPPHSPPPPPPPDSSANGNKCGAAVPTPPLNPLASPPPKPKPPTRPTPHKSHRVKYLKPLHWWKIDRVREGSLWAVAEKSGEAARAPEIDISEVEILFSVIVPKAKSKAANEPEKLQQIRRRAVFCEIMLSKVNIPLPELMDYVLALDDSAMDVNQVDNLIKFWPTNDEMELIKGNRGELGKLGKYELIMGSVKLRGIMQTILSLGNALNQGTARGAAVGFKLNSLLKLSDTKVTKLNDTHTRSEKMTLMHYLCKVLADKQPELLDFSKELGSLEPASKIQLKILAEEMQAITKGLEKVVQEKELCKKDGHVSKQFRKSVKTFLASAEPDVSSLASLHSRLGISVDALITYFGEDPKRVQYESRPYESVVETLRHFVRMFNQAHEENCKQIEAEKKAAQKESEQETLKGAEQDKLKAEENEKLKEYIDEEEIDLLVLELDFDSTTPIATKPHFQGCKRQIKWKQ